MRIILLLVTLLYSSFIYSSGNEAIIDVNNFPAKLDLVNYTYLYSSKDSSSDIKNVIDKEFVHSPKGLKGINDNTIYWKRYSFDNNSNQTKEYYIYLPYNIINKLVAYSTHEGDIEQIANMGMIYSKRNSNIVVGYPILVKLKPGRTNVYLYINHFYLALRTKSYLLTKDELHYSVRKSERIIWFWKGFYLFASLISLSLFLVTRIKMFSYYFLLNIGVGIYFSGELGEISQYLDYIPSNITANIKQTGVLLSFIMLPLLINQITPIAKLRPRMWKAMVFSLLGLSVSWFLCLIPYFLSSKVLLITTYIYNFYAPLILLLQVYFIFVAYKAKLKNSQFLFIGYSGYILAIFIYGILPNLGLLTKNIEVYNTFIYGTIFEIIMFMTLIGKETISVYQHRATLLEKQKSHQTEIIKAIVESQEKERNRVGRELHDMIGANISVIKQNIDKKNQTLIRIINKTIDSVRDLSHGLITPLIKGDEFVYEINELCVLFSNLDTNIRSHFHNWSKIDNSKTATHIYRIAQELLQNAIKHSKATEVTIQFIVNNDNELTIMYEDNGIGFDYEKESNNNGVGLMNIENRVRLIGANITYDTQANRKGTTVIIEVL